MGGEGPCVFWVGLSRAESSELKSLNRLPSRVLYANCLRFAIPAEAAWGIGELEGFRNGDGKCEHF